MSDFLILVTVVGIIQWLGVGGLAAYVANQKGYEFGSWLILGLLLGVFALIATIGLPNLILENRDAEQDEVEDPAPLKRRRLKRSEAREMTWECPSCRSLSPTGAAICKDCGYEKP